ncbi:O-methyltransferase [Rhodohalobacter sp.]|uniref:O-methyltransferase n=1 Tax=Rhodohalobacter sp. TaxID=1974210 RepID=UPI002ACF0412|nr:class I SAM-dependent methyltransferase [Rhodohalobacter sp.]MDZ7757023.1 class I SAM-dependent methyltransferase [Rhodohalobacter sp.]
MEITNKQIAEYTESFTSEEPEIIKELVMASDEDLEYIDMLSGRQTGMLLKMLVTISGAKRILEVGTFTGYSAIMMAHALPDGGELITCEMNERYRKISEPFFAREPYRTKITQKMGNALEIIPTLEGTFDLIFLDADKVNYPKYYRLAKKKINSGGLIVVDNVLWGGEVLDRKNRKAKAIHQMNEIIRDDDEVEQLMLPLRDGVTIVRVLS